MNIQDAFDIVMKTMEVERISRDSLTLESLIDLYTIVEEHRLPVAMIFCSTSEEEVMKEVTIETVAVDYLNLPDWEEGPNLDIHPPTRGVLEQTDEIRFLTSAWGADFYVTDKVSSGEVIAATVTSHLEEKGAVAKLYFYDKVQL